MFNIDVHEKKIKIFLIILLVLLVAVIIMFAFKINQEINKNQQPENISSNNIEEERNETQKEELETLRDQYGENKAADPQDTPSVNSPIAQSEESNKQAQEINILRTQSSQPTSEETVKKQTNELDALRNKK